MLILKEWVNRATVSLKDANNDIYSWNYDPNQGDIDFSNSLDRSGGFTPLHYASYHGNYKIIDMLVSIGANVYAENEQGINMVHVAAQGDQPYSLAYFLRKSTLSINSLDKA